MSLLFKIISIVKRYTHCLSIHLPLQKWYRRQYIEQVHRSKTFDHPTITAINAAIYRPKRRLKCRPVLISTVQIFKSCTSPPDVCYCLVVQTPNDNMSKVKPRTSIVHLACESKLRSVLRSSVHPRKCVAIGRAVV